MKLMLVLIPIIVLMQTTANVQKDLTVMYQRWDKAVVGRDKKTMESLLSADFAAKVKGSKKTMNKKEFINGITASWSKKDSPKEQSFVTKINKVMDVKSNFAAYIDESMVIKFKDGKTKRVAWKSLDTWKKFGKNWQIIATEPMDK